MEKYRLCGAGLVALMIVVPAAESRAAQPATAQEVADFWDTIFNGSTPYGVPPVGGTRTNQRVINNSIVWDVRFDSYRDPATDLPLSLGGVLAIPNGVTGPGPGGTFPGLIVTHSVGVSAPAPDNVVDMATFFAQRGYVTLAFYMRGWGTSQTVNNRTSNNDLFTRGLVGDGQMPLDNDFAGMAADCYQAGEFLAAQTEVWDPNGLSFIGHSGGGYAAMAAGIFSSRFSVISASAPANAAPDPDAWLDFWQPAGVMSWIASQSNPTDARSLIVRMLSFTGLFPVINSPNLMAKDATWRLDGTSLWLYGGAVDTSIPPSDVQAMFEAANPTTPALKAFHWSPTGGHGGPESWEPAQAWLAGHYPQGSTTAPTAALAATSITGTTVSLSAAGSTAWAFDWSYDAGSLGTDPSDIVSWVYDFGDGVTQDWGPSVDYTYATGGTYDVTLTITDGAGRRDSATIQVDVSGTTAVQFAVDTVGPFIVPEGGQFVFSVRLSAPPGAVINVVLSRDSGDTDLTVAPPTLGFSDANWSNWHTVTFFAAEDPDGSSDPAVFSIAAAGIPTVLINARENDNDTIFDLVAGTATGVSGSRVVLPIALVNAGGATVTAFDFEASFDGAALLNPTAAAGADLPGAAWWNFSYGTPSIGVVTISASEWVPPADQSINGDIVLLDFEIASAASIGSYPITLSAASVNGAAPSQVLAGTVVVVDAVDGGISDGGTQADGSGGDANTGGDPTPGASSGGGAAGSGCSCRSSGAAAGPLLVALFAIFRRRRLR